jgi:hypothetical protein
LLTEEQAEFKRVADAFAREELLPFAAQWDAEHHFPVDTLRRAAALGFGGLYVGDDVGGAPALRTPARACVTGMQIAAHHHHHINCILSARCRHPGALPRLLAGSGLGRLDAAVVFEALSYGDVPVTAYLSIHNMVASVIDRFGSEDQRRARLPALTSMHALASYCLTEPGAGSDAAALKTSARRHPGGGYVLDGAKAFISGGGVSDVYLVMARTGGPGPRGISAFLVDKGAAGLGFGKRERKLGWNAQPTTAVTFDGVRVGEGDLVGAEGEGFKIAMSALDGGRVNIAACSVGGAQFCLDTARAHARSRAQFGRPVAEFQGTQFKVADMATAVAASRLLVRHAAAALDAGAPGAALAAAQAKRFATDACYGVSNDALQLLGGYGYLQEYPIERVMRDLRVHSILEVSAGAGAGAGAGAACVCSAAWEPGVWCVALTQSVAERAGYQRDHAGHHRQGAGQAGLRAAAAAAGGRRAAAAAPCGRLAALRAAKLVWVSMRAPPTEYKRLDVQGEE